MLARDEKHKMEWRGRICAFEKMNVKEREKHEKLSWTTIFMRGSSNLDFQSEYDTASWSIEVFVDVQLFPSITFHNTSPSTICLFFFNQHVKTLRGRKLRESKENGRIALFQL
jgi:hypothetical protein